MNVIPQHDRCFVVVVVVVLVNDTGTPVTPKKEIRVLLSGVELTFRSLAEFECSTTELEETPGCLVIGSTPVGGLDLNIKQTRHQDLSKNFNWQGGLPVGLSQSVLKI